MNDAAATGAPGRGWPARVVWDRYPEAVRLFLRGVTVPVSTRIALVVGTWLTLVNQGAAIAGGSVPWAKVGLNVLTPFVVSSVGFLAARRRVTLERLWAELHDEPPGSRPPGSP